MGGFKRNTGWKPIVHYAVAPSLPVRGDSIPLTPYPLNSSVTSRGMLFLPARRSYDTRFAVQKSSKNPTDPAEKTPSWPKLRSENSDSSPVSQLVALIKNIGDVEPELEQTVILSGR